MSMGETFKSLYDQYKKDKFLGIYLFTNPALLITDPKVVQDILIRDFNSFHDRPMHCDEENDPLSGHLFSLPGQKWKNLRVKLTPTFTSGKLKGMFPTIKDCGKVLENYLEKNLKEGNDVIECRDLLARFNINIISSVAFGIENDCINEPDHIFLKMGKKVFEPSRANGIKTIIGMLAPGLSPYLKSKSVSNDLEDFMFTIVRQTIEHREKNNITRNDFMQLMIQLKNDGFVKAEKGETEVEEEKSTIKKLSINQVVAQAFVFFLAGFETSSSTLSFCLFELARDQKLQKKVTDEIDRVFKNATATGEVTYEMMSELKYAECCVDETLRKYPIVPIHLRKSTQDYKIAGSDLTIPKGTSVFIPVLGFHRDPEIYENPMEFRPERFLNSPNGGGNAEGVFYMPFGDGPRNCIGMRMGKLTTKYGLALLLSKYNIELTDREMQHKELEFSPNQFNLTPKKLFNFKLTPRVENS